MFILFVYFVCVNMFMIRTEDNIVKVEIKAGGQQGTCNVPQALTLVQDSNFTLEIESDYFIVESYWSYGANHNSHNDHLETLTNSKFNITYERNILSARNEIVNKFIYSFSHTKYARKRLSGRWIFRFDLIKNYDPWSYRELVNQPVEYWSCTTSVTIDPLPAKSPHNTDISTESPRNAESLRIAGLQMAAAAEIPGEVDWLKVVVSVFGILLLCQTIYIVYGKVRVHFPKRTRRSDEDIKRSIANRPPLPLPPGAFINEVPSAPPMTAENSYRSHPGPLVRKQSYINKALENSVEELRSPGVPRRHEGPLVRKQSYINEALKNSVEELRSPGFPKRHEGPVAPKQTYTNRELDDSDKELRSPGFARKQIQEPAPAPPLHPTKKSVLPPSAHYLQNEQQRLSDAEWQYETLQPSIKYLHNISNKTYNNT